MLIIWQSSESLQCYGLNLFQQLLRDSISNRASCVRAGMLNLLLDWFSLEDAESVILKITQLTRTIGGHSISGKDIRKIFALLRSERVGNQQKYRSLLLACLLSMLNEKGPTGFFDMNGVDSVSAFPSAKIYMHKICVFSVLLQFILAFLGEISFQCLVNGAITVFEHTASLIG